MNPTDIHANAMPCPACGYDLRAVASDDESQIVKCPECGRRTTGVEIATNFILKRNERESARWWCLGLSPTLVMSALFILEQEWLAAVAGAPLCLSVIMTLSLGRPRFRSGALSRLSGCAVWMFILISVNLILTTVLIALIVGLS